jgi:hypothetical protein
MHRVCDKGCIFGQDDCSDYSKDKRGGAEGKRLQPFREDAAGHDGNDQHDGEQSCGRGETNWREFIFRLQEISRLHHQGIIVKRDDDIHHAEEDQEEVALFHRCGEEHEFPRKADGRGNPLRSPECFR